MSKFYVHKIPKNEKSHLIPKFINICVSDFSKDEDGRIFISPELATTQEVDNFINNLIKQLEIIRNQAKKEFS